MIDKLKLRDFGRGLFDLLSPRECIVCGRELALHEKHLCTECLADLPRTHFSNIRRNQISDRFNAFIQQDVEAETAESGSEDAGTKETASREDAPAPEERTPFAYATALFFYRSATGYRKITQRLKYQADFKAGEYFSDMLGGEMAESPLFKDVDVILPVPLHFSRRWTRGYNQAEVIARRLSEHLGAPVRTDILCRPRRTRTQTKLSHESKMKNVQGAFKVRQKKDVSEYSHILLVDDVFTTGATLHSCYFALRKVCPPPVRISVATLAAVGK